MTLNTHEKRPKRPSTHLSSHTDPFFFFFSSVIAHMHISHHKDSCCQGQLGPRFSPSVDYKHTGRWPARPVYPQMATVEWSVWKVSATPAWPLSRWARLCHTSTLAHTQQIGVEMVNPCGLVESNRGNCNLASELASTKKCSYLLFWEENLVINYIVSKFVRMFKSVWKMRSEA